MPGWEDRGGGQLAGDPGNAMDLQAFDTVEELESLGIVSRLSCMLLAKLRAHAETGCLQQSEDNHETWCPSPMYLCHCRSTMKCSMTFAL